MEVVEFEALDERAVQHRGRRRAAGASGADDDRVASALQIEHALGGDP
jgi:hypothetical protein